MIRVMCHPLKRIFTLMPLVPLVPLTMFPPFIDDFVLFVVKGLLPLNMVESI